MKKNKAMRLASALLVLTLLTTCAISSTFAKYVTKAEGTDTARVAKWGFTQAATIELDNLFKYAYDNVEGNVDVIAPGTTNNATFGFAYGGLSGGMTAPEVAYTFEISTKGSSCDESIIRNTNIQWQLDDGAWGTWENMIKAIEALDGDKTYKPGELPDAFNNVGPNTHTVSWRWLFDENTQIDGGATAQNKDVDDTAMGNALQLAKVILNITVTATQVD